jgi:hypothetical protein
MFVLYLGSLDGRNGRPARATRMRPAGFSACLDREIERQRKRQKNKGAHLALRLRHSMRD